MTDPHPADAHDLISVRGARANNLRGVDLDLPKRRLTVFTGVSGSGKSSLVFDTIAAESQRLINETYPSFVQGFMPTPARPDVDVLSGLTTAIVVDQEPMGSNARSTVGTATDVGALLRILFSRLGAPQIGPPNAFSFNVASASGAGAITKADGTKERREFSVLGGQCPGCEGRGTVSDFDLTALFDASKSLSEGALTVPNYSMDGWYGRIFAGSGYFDMDKPLGEYTEQELDDLLYREATKIKVDGINVTYEGVITKIRKSMLAKDVESMQSHVRAFVERAIVFRPCPDCGGTRLNESARSVTVHGKNIAELSAMQITDLADWVRDFAATDASKSMAPLLRTLQETLDSFDSIGLGYLSLDRASGTLSGGEAQRVKMIRHLGSALSDVTYVFDEPTVGLHPHDITRMNTLLADIRDKGNTVLVVEHKPEVIRAADLVVDLGPGSGDHGGEVVFTGTPRELEAASTVTAESLHQGLSLRDTVRPDSGVLPVGPVTLNNLVDVSVDIPLGTLTVLTGVAGSGKSSLVTGGLVGRDGVAVVDQSAIRGSRRSTPATYTGMLDDIRKLFARRNRDAGATASMFSPNSDGACPTCHGQGVIYTDLAMMAGVSAPCEDCDGRRFRPEVLEYRVAGRDISEVLDMTVEEASTYFTKDAPSKPVAAALSPLRQVGLDYLRLGQPLTTLSGGERQRLKLASRIDGDAPVIVLDEPTTGLHLADTATLVEMMQNLVDAGHTLVVIEHNLAVIAAADHIIDIGPGAGHDGGQVVFEGSPAELVSAAAQSANLTGRYLAAAVH